jgi:hypothetical protein
MMSGIGSTIVSGMAFGAGSSIAHQYVAGVRLSLCCAPLEFCRRGLHRHVVVPSVHPSRRCPLRVYLHLCVCAFSRGHACVLFLCALCAAPLVP